MNTTEEKTSSTWGGARKGSGRKKTCAKRIFFSANQEVADFLDTISARDRSDFINECIIKAIGRS